ncbi:LysR family transcriptional regulator [Falsiroseomonas oryziterrae]|uniref:LysR substrate-binding domain-containing protein n=1 Tax=Falsiroseomonas oryziterrae TaxID=2911368 RepID=UPI001F3C6B38|nr:LysR family transcriptional regulator [Roseomonas sp. NPKOSM-4]
MLEVRELRLVQAVAEHGTLVRAARVLGVSQPALTRSLAALEAKLRGQLFERSRQGVIPTNLGRTVLAEAADILARLDRLDSAVAEVRGGQVRELRIVAGTYVGETLGHRAAARMLSVYPATRIRLIAGDWAEVPRVIHAREASLGILDLRGHEPDPGLVVERLRPQPGVFVVRRGHPLASRPEVTLADILAFPLIMIGRLPQAVQGPMAAAREAARAAGRAHPAFPAMIQDSPSVAVGLLRHCDAVTAATLPVAHAALRAGDVEVLRWRAPWVSLHPGVARLRGHALGEAEQGYLDLLRDVDREVEQEGQAWLAELGLSAECG